MNLKQWLKSRKNSAGPDGFRFDITHPLGNENAAISQLLEDFEETHLPDSWYSIDLSKLDTFAQIPDLDLGFQVQLVGALVERLVLMRGQEQAVRTKHGALYHLSPDWHSAWGRHLTLTAVLSALLRKKLPLSENDVTALIRWCTDDPEAGPWSHPLSAIAIAVENFAARNPLPESARALLTPFLGRLQTPGYYQKGLRKSAERVIELLGCTPDLPIESGEAWADVALADLRKSRSAQLARWTELLTHARSASGSAPSAKWSKTALPLLKAVGVEIFSESISRWFPLTDRRRTIPALDDHAWRGRCAIGFFERNSGPLVRALETIRGAGREFWKVYDDIRKEMQQAEDPWHYLRNFQSQDAVRKYFRTGTPTFDPPENPPPYNALEDHLLSEPNMDILRGLAWMCGLCANHETARALTALALSAYRKVPGKGPRAVRVGNACITALGMMPGLDAVGQLALLKVKVKFGTAQKAIEKALTAAAEREGLPREELEEMAVPAYGLTEVGRLVETLGEFTAELAVTGSKTAAITWRRADGKVQKSLPAAVKKEFAEELKELNAAKKDIEKMLPAQAERIDSLFLQQKIVVAGNMAGALSRTPARRHARAAVDLEFHGEQRDDVGAVAKRQSRRSARSSGADSMRRERRSRFGIRSIRRRRWCSAGAGFWRSGRSCSRSSRRTARCTCSRPRRSGRARIPIASRRTSSSSTSSTRSPPRAAGKTSCG